MVVADIRMPVSCNTCHLTCEGCDELTSYCHLNYREVWNVPEGERDEKCPIKFRIPDDAIGLVGIQKGDTNGAVMMTLYPNAKWRYDSTVRRILEDNMDISFSVEWWDAPYKRGSEEV